MTLRMLVDGLHEEETRMVIADDDELIEFDIESSFKKQNKGNIYLAKVTRVEPSLQAAFVEYGSGRQGFLPFSEIHPDYYQIPVADKQELLRAQAEQREQEEREAEEEMERAERQGTQPNHDRNRNRNRNRNNDQQNAGENSDNAETGDQLENVDNNYDDNRDQNADHGNPDQHQHDGDTEYELNKTGISEAVASQQVENSDIEGSETSVTEQVMPLPVNIEEVHRESGGDAVEELGSDEPFEERPKRHSIRRYKIQEVIKKNQVVLIQVIKEERGNKGASVTSYISLPGRYCVLMPNTNRGGGVSRKINDIKERKKLKETIEGLDIKDGMSVIMRTAGMGRTKADITRDYAYLIKLWNNIREATLAASAPALVHEEGNVIKRSLRDFYNNDVSDIIVAGEKAFETAREFMKLIMPSHSKKVVKYEEDVPIFHKYGVEQQLISMNDPVVTLNSGGYIVINTTEALISIDVNSGRATGERNVEDTATRTNIDAAWEIARQLRLRDLAGLIVIDFIDMLGSGHRRSVERTLKDALKNDRAKIQVGRISPFGLLEMSRQRLRPSITEISMVECPSCKGIGHIRSSESAMVQLARSIENELALAKGQGHKIIKVIVSASTGLALYFLNNKRKRIAELEAQYGFEMSVEVGDMPPSTFRIQLEDETGNKSRIISSDDREGGKLPQSRGDKSRRGGGKRGDRNRDRNRNERGGNDRNRDRDRNRPSNEGEEGEVSNEEGHITEVGEEGGENENRGNREGGNREPRELGPDGRPRRNRRRRNRSRGRGRDRNDAPRSFEGAPREGGLEAQSSPTEELITSGSFEPSNFRQPRPPRQQREPQPRVDSGEESPSGYAEKPVKEITHASQEASDEGGDSQGNRKGWWRKMIE